MPGWMNRATRRRLERNAETPLYLLPSPDERTGPPVQRTTDADGPVDGPDGGPGVVPVRSLSDRDHRDRRTIAERMRSTERRPVVPEWLRDPRSTLLWAARYLAHAAAFHALRLPVYFGRAVANTPRGIVRAALALGRWAADSEAHLLRGAAVDRGDVAGYLMLSRQRNARVKSRVPTALAAAAGAALAVTAGVTSPAARVPTVLALIAAAGWYGRPLDRPMIDAAVVTAPGARPITPDLLVQAFTAAGLCKADNPITFGAPVVRDGAGWRAVVDLPFGETASKAVGRREQIAAGLDVDEVRVFLDRVRGTTGSARRVIVWVADTDPYAEKPPVTPLAKATTWDFWSPFPFGIDARQRPVNVPLVWSSLLIGAIPRMGKTYAARLPVAAAALDPYVRLLVFDGKGGKDWQPFEAVAHRYGSGVRQAVVEHLVVVLREAVEDMDRRFERLRTLPNDVCPEGKVTPAITRNKRLDMPLVVIAIDEVQRYLEHPDHGKTILALLTELAKVGPAVGYMLDLATQRPDANVLPENLRGQIGTRFALRTMNWQASETILGAGTYKAGLDASKFLSAHKGVGILLGADDGELAEAGGLTVRTHLLDLPTLVKIIDRARENRIAAGTLTGAAAGEELIAESTPFRLLEDVLDVFGAGEDKLWSETICARLADTNATAYDGWSPTDLAGALRPYGVTTGQVWGQTPEGQGANRRGVAREGVLDALARRLDHQPDRPNGRREGGPDGGDPGGEGR